MDRNRNALKDTKGEVVATREGDVDRNKKIMINRCAPAVATREGGVDRNVYKWLTKGQMVASPPARVAWIETAFKPGAVPTFGGSPPARVAWIETCRWPRPC